MARKLASIQVIRELHDIAGADKIEVASILGWKVIARKDEFKVGDKCVYCEIDCLLPDREEFKFLTDKKGRRRIKTIRLRGQISQGICFPISILPIPELANENDDVTEVLGIEKYIPQIPANIAGDAKGTFPTFVSKTDETRVQILQDVLTRNKGTLCYVTEKVDGCSATYFLKDNEFGVCSRNIELKEDTENLFWKMAKELKIEEKLRAYGKNLAIQGELIGLGVQKNNLRIPENKVLFFNVFDIDKFQYLNYAEAKDVLDKFELESVPFIKSDFILIDDIDALVEIAKGFSLINPKVYREGIVIRPLIEKFDFKMSQGLGNGRLTFKAVNPDYLLKYEE